MAASKHDFGKSTRAEDTKFNQKMQTLILTVPVVTVFSL
jgi:hypothetical protein